EHRVQAAHRLELLCQRLGLRRVDGQRLDDREATLADQLGQDRRHAGAIHLLVHLLGEVLVGAVREDPAASAPQRRRGHAGAGAAGALLAPRLLGGVLDHGAVELGAGAQARVGLEGDDDLVHQRLVVVAREDRVGRLDLGGRLALVVEKVDLHQFAPFLATAFLRGALTAGRTTTWPFFAPGTAPRTSSSWRASSMRTMSRFWVVLVTLPSWPDIFLPGNTRPGSCAIEIEPGTLCERLLPCEARCDLKLWRL